MTIRATPLGATIAPPATATSFAGSTLHHATTSISATRTALRARPAVAICAVAVSVVGGVLTAVPAPADGGCIPGDQAGLVQRNAAPGDTACVTPAIAALVQQENKDSANGVHHDPNGPAGPVGCVSGFVWREAFDGDGVCVTPARRTETFQENANAGIGDTGGLKPQTGTPGGSVGTGGPDGALLAAVNDARLHPENYPPNGNSAGATMSACPKPLGDSFALDTVAATHNNYLATAPGSLVNQYPNMHLNPPPNGVLSWAPNGPIAQAGYNMRAEIVATGFPAEADAVVFWMQNDEGSKWDHRNNILKCSYTDAGAAQLTGGDLGKYWTVDLGAHS
jgi:hypothetical protein